jgi:hypothetical protein
MQTVCSSKTLVQAYYTTPRQSPEHQNIHHYRRKTVHLRHLSNTINTTHLKKFIYSTKFNMFISYYNLKYDTITAIDMIMYKGHVKQCEPSGRYITVTDFRSETYV